MWVKKIPPEFLFIYIFLMILGISLIVIAIFAHPLGLALDTRWAYGQWTLLSFGLLTFLVGFGLLLWPCSNVLGYKLVLGLNQLWVKVQQDFLQSRLAVSIGSRWSDLVESRIGYFIVSKSSSLLKSTIHTRRGIWLELSITMGLILLSIFTAVFIINNITNEPLSDFKEYYQRAVNYADGKNIYTILKPIGYPIILGNWFKLTNNDSVENAKLLNIIFFAISLLILSIFSFKSRIPARARIGFIAWISLCPTIIFFTNVLGVETTSLLVMILISYVYLVIRGRELVKVILLGILIGVLSSLKSYFVFFPAVILFVDLITTRNVSISLRNFLITTSVFFITILPFVVENYNRTGHFIVVPSNMNIVIYINNNNENLYGGWMSLTDVIPSTELIQRFQEINKNYGESCYECVNLYGKYGIRWIFYHPKEFITLGILRLNRIFFSPGMINWAVHQHVCMDSSCDEKVLKRNINLLQSISDTIMYIFSGLLAVLLLKYTSVIFTTLLNRKNIDRLLGFSFFAVLFQICVYFIGEGQPRYIHSFIFFGSLIVLHYVVNKGKAESPEAII
jgi:hypothetical protein